MTTMLAQLKEKDFSDWKKVFDSAAELRKSRGELSHLLYQDAGDPNAVTIVYKMASLENARKFAQSPELKAAREKAGVQGQPSFTFLTEI